MKRVVYSIEIERVAVMGATRATDAAAIRGAVTRAISRELAGSAALSVRAGGREVLRTQAPSLSGARAVGEAVAVAVVRAAKGVG